MIHIITDQIDPLHPPEPQNPPPPPDSPHHTHKTYTPILSGHQVTIVARRHLKSIYTGKPSIKKNV